MDKNSIQIISDFSEKVRGKDGIKYADYAEIRRIQEKDIPKAKDDIKKQLDYVKVSKNPDGTPKTPEQISLESAEWQKYLDSIVALENAWKNSALKVEKHHEENYEKVVSETRAKLAELFGEVNGKVPAPAPVTQVTQPAKVDSAAITPTIPRTPEATTKDIEGFKGKSYSIDGKKVDFIKIDKINDRHEITLKIDNSTQQTFYLNQDTDKSWKAVEPTINDYNIIFKNNEVTITTKKSEAISAGKPAPQDIHPPVSGKTPEKPTAVEGGKQEEKGVQKTGTQKIENKEKDGDTVILQRNKEYIAKKFDVSKITDDKIKGLLQNPTKDAVKKFQEENDYEKEYGKKPDGIMGDKTKELINKFKQGKQSPNKVEKNSEVTISTNEIINTATQFMQRIINLDSFNRDFVETMNRGGSKIIKDPFNTVIFPLEAYGDLQLTDKTGIYSYKALLTSNELVNWRKLSTDDKNKIITTLNTEWNKRAQEKLDIIQGKKTRTTQSNTNYRNEGENYKPKNPIHGNENLHGVNVPSSKPDITAEAKKGAKETEKTNPVGTSFDNVLEKYKLSPITQKQPFTIDTKGNPVFQKDLIRREEILKDEISKKQWKSIDGATRNILIQQYNEKFSKTRVNGNTSTEKAMPAATTEKAMPAATTEKAMPAATTEKAMPAATK